MQGLGETSAHWLIAQIAVETGISPNELASLDPRMLWTIQRALIAKGNQSRKPRKGKR
jgi:hypothetical protein